MKRITILAACLGLLLPLALEPAKTSAAVSISLRIGDPYPGPRLVFVDRPAIVLIPGTRVSYIEDYDLYRYGRYWYFYYDGGWYRGLSYDGPFYFISYLSVPRPIRFVPVKYRHHWRSYRGPAYAYYHAGRWYREKPGANVTRGTSDGKQSGGKGRGKDRDKGQGGGKGKGRGHGR